MRAHILVGTPAYGGQVSSPYLRAIIGLTILCRERDVGLTLFTIDRESLISRARNVTVAEFLGDRGFSHLLFIDADIGFQPATVLRLLAFGKPVVGCAYPLKRLDWQQVLEAAPLAKDGRELQQRAAQFVLNLHDEDAPIGPRPVEVPLVDGFIRVSKTGSGFLMIERAVFDRLIARYPERRYENDIAGYDNERTRGNFWTFFDAFVHPKSRRYLSEDYGFCHLWTQGCGGEIWCDIESELTHFGSFGFAGSCLVALQRSRPAAEPG